MKMQLAKLNLRTRHENVLGPKGGPGALMFEQQGRQARVRRAPVRAIAMYHRLGVESGGELFGQVLNLSPDGCLLRTEATMADGVELELTITIVGKGQRTSATVRGHVLRMTEHEGRRAYGIQFDAQTTREKETQQWLYAHANT